MASCKSHSLFLTENGSVYSCGVGFGGRLGHGNTESYFHPKKIESLQDIVQVAVSDGFSLFLSKLNSVFGCGVREFAEFFSSNSIGPIITPKSIYESNCQIHGIAASPVSCLIFEADKLKIWGSNTGQAGITGSLATFCNMEIFIAFADQSSIRMVSVRSEATAVLLSNADVFVFHKYTATKVPSRALDITKVVMSSQDNKLVLLMLSNSGIVYFWSSGDGVVRLNWRVPQSMQCSLNDVSAGGKYFAFVARGRVFYCPLKSIVDYSKECCDKKMSKNNILGETDSGIFVRPLLGIRKALRLSCDVSTGTNMHVLCFDPQSLIRPKPVPSGGILVDFKNLVTSALNSNTDFPSTLAYSSLIAAMASFENADSSDLTTLVNNLCCFSSCEFSVDNGHGIVRGFPRYALYARIPFFRVMFSDGMTGDEIRMSIDCSEVTLNLLADYIADESCLDEAKEESLDTRVVQELLVLADFLLFDQLKLQCGTYLRKCVHSHNVFDFIYFSYRYKVGVLLNGCFELLLEDLDTFYELETFHRLTGDPLSSFVSYLKLSVKDDVSEYPLMTVDEIWSCVNRLSQLPPRKTNKRPRKNKTAQSRSLTLENPLRESENQFSSNEPAHNFQKWTKKSPSSPPSYKRELISKRETPSGWTVQSTIGRAGCSLTDIMREQSNERTDKLLAPKPFELLQLEARAVDEIREYYEAINGGDDYVVTCITLKDSASNVGSKWPARPKSNSWK